MSDQFNYELADLVEKHTNLDTRGQNLSYQLPCLPEMGNPVWTVVGLMIRNMTLVVGHVVQVV